MDRESRIKKIQEAEVTLINDILAAFLYFQIRIVILNLRGKNIYFKGVGAEYHCTWSWTDNLIKDKKYVSEIERKCSVIRGYIS